MEKDPDFIGTVQMEEHRIVTQEQWTAAHKKNLEEQKAFIKLYDNLISKRRQLPWVKVEKEYIFQSRNGQVGFADLFEGRNQLVVQHFMFGPDAEEGCVGCSFSADHVDCARVHFEHNNLSFVAVSRGPIDRLLAYKRRMGWTFNWVSSYESDFNYDFHVSFRKDEIASGRGYYNFEITEVHEEELPGMSVFYKNVNGEIFHTYSCYGREGELLIGAYHYLDMTPIGRNEVGLEKNRIDWVHRHDEYKRDLEDGSVKHSCCN